jgi:Cu+-exporting ATPase
MPVHTDPVCHMQVDQNTAAAQSEHQGTRYYFCSPGCKAKFDANPGKYAAAPR